MRIAYISYEYPPDSSNGGIATYVYQIAHVMAARGHQVEVFAASPLRNATVEADGVTVHWVKETDRLDFGIVAGHRFAQRHAEAPFDVLEGPEYHADARKAVALVPEVPLVLKMHTPSRTIVELNERPTVGERLRHHGQQLRVVLGNLLRGRAPDPYPFRTPALERGHRIDRLERRHARQATLVAPPCGDLVRHAREVWGIAGDRLRLAPYPYLPTPAYLDIPVGMHGARIGFVGRLERRKGIEDLARAIPLVLKARPEARFVFIGAAEPRHASNEPYDTWLKRELAPWKERVEFRGKVPLEQMAEAYRDLDVLVYPSLWENFPNVCLEAMSAGRAIVASSAGGMREQLDEGRCGRLVPPNDHRALAAAILAHLNDPTEAARMAAAARQRVLTVYTRETIGELYEVLY